jgi:hypothetical protein
MPSTTVRDQLLNLADRIVQKEERSSLPLEEKTGWDNYDFDPARSYLPMPVNAELLVVSRYDAEVHELGKLVRATYFIPSCQFQ